jgi:protein-disulfide isomerase
MSSWLRVSLLLLIGCACACQPPAAADPSLLGDGLSGVDTSTLTRSEREVWSELVTEQLAPCPNVPSSIADCVKANAPCAACKPAASLLARQVQRGKSKVQAEKFYHARFDAKNKLPVDPSGSPSKGPANAPITIVEWADFECAFCQKAAPIIEEQRQRLKDQVRVVFKHFPISKHLHATQLAKFAIAAENQGKFWEAHALLFAGAGGELDDAAVTALAEKLGLDPTKVLEDMKAPSMDERILRERTQADQLGLKGTPFILINARQFDFDLFDLEEDLPSWLDTELELISGGSAKP